MLSLQDADEIEYAQVYPEIVAVPDPEILKVNLVENKHHRLTRSMRSGTMTRELKPNAKKRDQLAVRKNIICVLRNSEDSFRNLGGTQIFVSF